MVTPVARREAVSWIRDRHELSERRACRLTAACRSMVRYERLMTVTGRAGGQPALRFIAVQRIVTSQGSVTAPGFWIAARVESRRYW